MTGKKVKMCFVLLIIIISVLGTYGNVLAKNPEFRLDIDSLNLQKGAGTTLVLSLVNADGAQVSEITGLENFEVMSTNQSNSTQIINGDITIQRNISYVIMPKTVGQFKLQGIIKYSGNTYQTNEITVNVSEAKNLPSEEVSDLFIRTVISSDEIYLGQKVVMTYELYSRYNIEDYGFRENIEIDGFLLSDVPEDKLKAEYVYLEGNKYVKYEVRQLYLSPIKAGTFNIPEYNFQVNVSTGGGFFSSSEAKYLKTEGKQLTVKPLPENKPSDFSGIVGTLNLESEYSRQEVPYGDSLTLKVTASGNCDLSVLDKISKGGIPDFTVYETAKDVQESIVDNQYSALKEYEIILVPEKSGEVKISPIYISYFDTASGSYKKAEIQGASITVTGEAPQVQTQAQTQINGTSVTQKVVVDKVNYTPLNEGYLIIQLKKEHLYVGLIVLAILVILLVAGIFLPKQFKKQDKALLNMYKQLKSAKDEKEIYSILNNMIKYRFNLSLKASPKDVIKAKLIEYNLDDKVLEIMDYMESGKNQEKQSEAYLRGKVNEIYKVLALI
ncbi:MAG: hypothetical protein BWY74_03391 [Firmicutes bacterium ADurb.Bin419]|nr:MAG: hypothetical protein BWY74_03391 [Firmicutes bacterium ADurb.Bin419]